MRLLIVEDNRSMRRLLKSILRDMAEVVGECEDGSQALAAYEELLPDLVLMDLRMENVDGIEATRQIKTAHAEAHIIVVTEYDDAKLREAARDAGASSYVIKENLFALRRLLESL